MMGRNRLKLAALVVGRLIVGAHTQVNRGSLAFADRHHGRCPAWPKKQAMTMPEMQNAPQGFCIERLKYEPWIAATGRGVPELTLLGTGRV
jgi:hypothetical protein